MKKENTSKSAIINFFVLPIILLLVGCQENNKNESTNSHKLNIAVTTGMIEDAVKNITGDSAEVTALMGPGVDPHLYKATHGDLKKLQNADIIVFNGLHLEGKMLEVFEKLKNSKTTIAMAEGIDKSKLRKALEFKESYDPHIWFSVPIWKDGVKYISSKIIEKDPNNASFYKANTEKYLEELDSLDKWVRHQIKTIPDNSRILITAHDAFGYFGDEYSIAVKGLQGISTLSDFGLNDISGLTDFIAQNKVKSVFIESSVPPRAIEAVVEGARKKGHEVTIGGTLFSDAMGPENTKEGTYIGMVTHNVNTLVNGLK